MHTRLEKAQFSELSVTLKPDYCQSGPDVIPILEDRDEGKAGWRFASLQGSKHRTPPQPEFAGLSCADKAGVTIPLGFSLRIPGPYL